MAHGKEKQREKKKIDLFEQAERDAEKKLRENKLIERKQDADRRIDEQCDKYLDAVEKYGEEDPLTVMLATLLDVVIPLQELANQMVTMTDMMNTFGATLDLIDMSIENIFDVFDEKTKYGLFNRIKGAYKIAVFKGNLKRRMKKILQSVRGMQQLSVTLKKSLASLAGKNSKMLRKAAAKKAKKGTNPENGTTLSGLAAKMVNERRAARASAAGETVTNTESSATAAASTSAAAATDTTTDGNPGVDGLMP